MPDPVYLLSERDRDAIIASVSAQMRELLNIPNRPAVPPSISQSPEVYIAVTPADGIPAAALGDPGAGTGTGTAPGEETLSYADCEIYRLHPNGQIAAIEPQGFERRVYNLYETAVPGEMPIPVTRDKWGAWWSLWCPGTGGGEGAPSPPNRSIQVNVDNAFFGTAHLIYDESGNVQLGSEDAISSVYYYARNAALDVWSTYGGDKAIVYGAVSTANADTDESDLLETATSHIQGGLDGLRFNDIDGADHTMTHFGFSESVDLPEDYDAWFSVHATGLTTSEPQFSMAIFEAGSSATGIAELLMADGADPDTVGSDFIFRIRGGAGSTSERYAVRIGGIDFLGVLIGTIGFGATVAGGIVDDEGSDQYGGAGFTVGNAGDWSGSPTTLGAALDRIAAAVAGLLGGTIP